LSPDQIDKKSFFPISQKENCLPKKLYSNKKFYQNFFKKMKLPPNKNVIINRKSVIALFFHPLSNYLTSNYLTSKIFNAVFS